MRGADILDHGSAQAALRDLSSAFCLCGVGELLEHVAPFIPPELVDAAARARLARLPTLPAVCSLGAFECRLEAGESRVDFEVCLRVAGGGRAALAERLDEWAATGARGNAWSGTVAFLRDWCDPSSVLYDAVPVVWLEFDLESEVGAPAAPFLVFTLDPIATFRAGTSLHPKAMEAVASGIALLSRDGIDAATSRTLAQCLRRLPPSARLLHVAVRPGQSVEHVRVILRMPRDVMMDYLDEVGWRGDTGDLRRFLDRAGPSTDNFSVNLDVAATLGPRAGVEHCFPTSPAEDARWQAVLGALVERGACAPEKRVALEAWPSSANRGGATGLLRVTRELLIKVVHEAGMPPKAKAYLPFGAQLNLTA